MFAVIRVRGIRKIKPRIKKTLELLRLHKPNHCVIVRDSPTVKGMLNVAKDYIAYGVVDDKMIAKLLYKRGKIGSIFLRDKIDKKTIEEIAKEIFEGKKKVSEVVDPVFCLHPPRKGYKNIKLHYPRGDLGRHDDISKLLNRML
ncbi:MAG: 50S ribosomal protein L30 [Candidatus Bilamarchaeaceae archaeon]